MTNLFIINAAIFLAVAVFHGIRLGMQAEVSIGGLSLPVWVSVLGLVVALALACANWRALPKRGKSEWLTLALALVALDGLVALVSWAAGLAYWGFEGTMFLWWALGDLVVLAILGWMLKRK